MTTPIELIINGRDNTGGAFSSAQSGISKIGQIAAGILTSQVFTQLANTVKNFAVSVVQEAQEAALVQGQLQAVLTSTGGAAGVTAEMVNQLADALQYQSAYTDEAIISGQNMLLTFTNIGKDVFPAATQTILDMSAALGQDLNASAMQLGKALNDPIQGVTALRRVGVQLTDEQENMVKQFMAVGDTASAQRVILDELAKEFGGSARSQVTSMDLLKKRFDNIKETIGTALLPTINKLGDTLGAALDNPEVQAAITQFTTWLSDAAPKALDALIQGFNMLKLFSQDAGRGLADFVRPFLPAISSIRDTLEKMRPTLEKVGAAMMEKLAAAGKELGEKVFPFLVEKANQFADWFAENRPLIEDFAEALSVAFGFVLDVIVELWDTVEPLLDALMEAILGLAEFVMEVATGDWAGAWETIQETTENVLSLIDDAIINFLDGIASLMGTSLKEIGNTWKGNWNQLKQIVSSVTEIIKNTIRSWLDNIKNAITTAWNNIVSTVTNAVNNMKNAVSNAMNQIVSAVTNAANSIRTAFSNALQAAQSAISSGLSSIRNLFSTALAGVISSVASWGGNLVSALVSAVTSAISSLGGALGAFVNLGASMISKIIDGIRANIGRLVDYIKGIVQNVITSLLGGLGGSAPVAPSGKMTGVPVSGFGGISGASSIVNSGSTITNYYNPTINVYSGQDQKKIIRGLI